MRTHCERWKAGVPDQFIPIHGYNHWRGLKAMPSAFAQRNDTEQCHADERQPENAKKCEINSIKIVVKIRKNASHSEMIYGI